MVKTGYRITGPYRWDAVATRAYAVRTNTVPAGSFRGFGGTQASFASESQIDMIARRLGIDPHDFRCKNLLAPGESFRPGDSNIDSDLARGLDAPANATPLTYRVPLAGDLPHCHELFVLEHGGPGPFGTKGIGESGMLGVAAAIANAIEDAVGVRVTQIPFTPERGLAAIEAAR